MPLWSRINRSFEHGSHVSAMVKQKQKD